MQDYWNDPPDEPEMPECCDDEMSYQEDGTALCLHCGHKIEPHPDPEDFLPVGEHEQEAAYPVNPMDKCPHGNAWGDCDACDHAADLAYDAAREQRTFNR